MWWTADTGLFKTCPILPLTQNETTSNPAINWEEFLGFIKDISTFLCKVYIVIVVSVCSKKGFDRKIGTTKSSFPLRVIKAESSLFQTHCRGNLCLSLPFCVQPLLVTSLRSIEDQIGCSVFFQIQYTRAGSEWATGVGDNTYRRWILRRPGRTAPSRAQPHMGI